MILDLGLLRVAYGHLLTGSTFYRMALLFTVIGQIGCLINRIEFAGNQNKQGLSTEIMVTVAGVATPLECASQCFTLTRANNGSSGSCLSYTVVTVSATSWDCWLHEEQYNESTVTDVADHAYYTIVEGLP